MLDVQDIHVYYGNIEALKGVSLQIRNGEIVTLIGANGAGKSTTLNAISGLQRPRSGTIIYAGPGPDQRASPTTWSRWGSPRRPKGAGSSRA